MTEFHYISLGIGVGLVAAVWLFNVWQEHRYKKKAAAAFARNHPDVLLETPKNHVRPAQSANRMEPSIVDTAAPTAQDAPPVAPELVEDFDSAATLDLDAVQALAAVMLDPQLDYIAEVGADQPIAGGLIPAFNVGKRIKVVGLNENDVWEIAAVGNRYLELRIGLQLCDRQGAVSEGQLILFTEQVSEFAASCKAVATFPNRQDKLDVARELDQFCAQVDAIIGLNVGAGRGRILVSQVATLCESAGMQLLDDGNFHALSESGKTLFSVASIDEVPFSRASFGQDQCSGLTLLLDVPRVADGLAAFDRMADLAQQLALTLGGDVVDDNGRSLKPADLAAIRKQLGVVYTQMDDRGIAAGSVAALRLFA